MNCSFELDLSLDEWADRLLIPLEGGRLPISGSIELTERCNLSCVHCYIRKDAGDLCAKSNELGLEQWKSIIDQIAEEGCLFLLLTGGEPLLHPDFIEIFKHARQRGMLISLFSSATMISPEIADILAEYNLHSLEVSLYGATQETYEQVTGVPGSFKRCLRGIELAMERHIPVSLKSVLLTLNFHELHAMQALTENLGLKYRYDYTLWPRLDGDLTPLKYQIPDEAALALDSQDLQRRDAWLDVDKQFQGIYLRANRVFTCGAAYRSFHINSGGKVSPCMMVRRPSYDLLEVGFKRAWEMLGLIHTWKREKHTECETCTINALCSQCPGWSLAVFDDFETPVPHICEFAKKRALIIKRIIV